MNTISRIKANGFCWIGDPHVSSVKPGTRNDRDIISTSVGKLDQSVAIANEKNLIPLIAGDLFDINDDTKALLLTRLIRSLNKCKHKAYELLGNSHDKTEVTLTDDAALAILREAGTLNVIEKSGFFLIIELPNGKTIGVGATPHGIEIPKVVVEERKQFGVDLVVWLTHHDLAFDGAYPGAIELFEIQGCDMVINGHMHLTKKAIVHGQTSWFNPGNILRQTKDTANHIPAVWLNEGLNRLIPVPLKYVEKVFDAVTNTIATTPVHLATVSSNFSAMLKDYDMLKDENDNVAVTEDGSEIAKELNLLYEEKKVDKNVRLLLDSLLAASIIDNI